jgi:hypothetical protein
MIERLIFPGESLPQFYEVTVNGGRTSLDECGVLSAEFIEEAKSAIGGEYELSREDTILGIIKHYAATEDVPEPSYSVRMLRPKETRKHLRTAVRTVMWNELLDAPPFKQLANTMIHTMTVLPQLEAASEQIVTEE